MLIDLILGTALILCCFYLFVNALYDVVLYDVVGIEEEEE